MTPPLRPAEDLVAGTTYDLGDIELSAAEIVEFARTWDPQPFHTDESSTRSHYFGGVVASGVHVVACFQRLAVLAVYREWDVYAGRSLTDVRFRKPARAGMRLHGELTIRSVVLTDDERAMVTIAGRLLDGGDPVLELTVEVYVYRRRVTSPA